MISHDPTNKLLDCCHTIPLIKVLDCYHPIPFLQGGSPNPFSKHISLVVLFPVLDWSDVGQYKQGTAHDGVQGGIHYGSYQQLEEEHVGICKELGKYPHTLSILPTEREEEEKGGGGGEGRGRRKRREGEQKGGGGGREGRGERGEGEKGEEGREI